MYKYKFNVIGPVRNSNPTQIKKIQEWVDMMECLEYSCYWSYRDTDQSMDGLSICKANRAAMLESENVAIYYDTNSVGSHFDMGMLLMMTEIRPVGLVIINEYELVRTPYKSFINTLLDLSQELGVCI